MITLENMKLTMLRKSDDDAILVPKTMDDDDSTIGTNPHSGDHGEGSGYDSSVDNGD